MKKKALKHLLKLFTSEKSYCVQKRFTSRLENKSNAGKEIDH
ncbi:MULTISPECIES: hypothetical protein [Lactobacillus]|nr:MULTISPECIES: hypothetical protein [Lactobacillus]